ncbi:hypothetical protein L484_026757 [Morus notabilis]|uniref:Uncharacterized protein n=1 Tax=Morus notabilis TaxID=981085 RepID=W9T0Z6_9ROSA|nr:hypothetical protein L484_026757 [Morus notabilis]
MVGFGGWASDFAMPHVFLRWLVTVAAVRNYLSCDQADDTVTVAMSTHAVICWCCYLLIAYLRAPSRISSFEKFRRFFFSLPEFRIWCSTAMALNVAIVTAFSLPKEEVVLAVPCYIVGFYAWLFYLAFKEFRSRRGRPTDENNDQALKYLELHTPLDSIMRNY